jgi:hypothetical protein
MEGIGGCPALVLSFSVAFRAFDCQLGTLAFNSNMDGELRVQFKA